MSENQSGGFFGLMKTTFSEFSEDGVPQMSAALAYYTVFSLPPLLVLIIMITSFFTDPQTIRETIEQQFGGVLGPQAGAEISTMIENASKPGSGGIIATILSIAGLIFGATGAFAQLQTALNKAWEVEADPEQAGFNKYLQIGLKRLFSLAMVLVIAFLLLVSLVLSAALTVIGDQLANLIPTALSHVFWQIIHLAVSMFVITLLFAAMYKILPDARVAWRDVWVGALFTTVLFVIGKFLIGLYIGSSDPGSAFGVAGSLAVLLIWVYYSALIFFLGAEFTQVWARRNGKQIRPSKGAVRVIEEKRLVRADQMDGQGVRARDREPRIRSET